MVQASASLAVRGKETLDSCILYRICTYGGINLRPWLSSLLLRSSCHKSYTGFQGRLKSSGDNNFFFLLTNNINVYILHYIERK